jgi:tetratricopeptide (TPR) repeat protein
VSDKNARSLLLVILILSLLLRFAYYQDIAGTDLFQVPFLDCLHYQLWAQELLSGDWGVGEPYWMGPLYPHYLALVYLFTGVDSPAPQIIQLLLSVLNIALVFLLARRLTSPAVALLAAALYAGYGPAVFYAGLLLMATLMTTLLLLAAIQAVRCLEQPSSRRAFVLGALVVVTALARGNVLLLVPVLPLLFIGLGLPRRQTLRLGLMALLGAAAVLLPITARNVLVGRDLVLLTSNGGMNLYLGQKAAYGGIFGPVDADQAVQFDPSGEWTLEREFGRDLKPSEVSRIFTRRALQEIVAHPWPTVKLYLIKIYRFWNGYELPQLAAYDHWRRESWVLQILAVPFTLLAAAGLLGILLGRGHLRRVLGLFVGTYFLSLLPFFITARYRLPIVPLLAVATASYLVTTGQALLTRVDGRWRLGPKFREGWRRVALLGALLVALLPGWADFDREKALWAIQINQAGRLVAGGDVPGALAAVQAADAAYPDYAGTFLKKGDIHRRAGEDAQALAAFQQAEKLAPRERVIPYNVGRTLHRLNELDEALAAFDRCIALDPAWPRGYFGKAMVQRDLGDLPAAIATMAQAVAAQPGAVHYRNNLASLYAENGQLDRAQATLQELLQRYESYVKGWINLALVSYNLGQLEAATRALDQADAIRRKEPEEEENIRRLRALIAAGPPLR